MLKLNRPLLVIDMETTGTDPVTDRIIEMGVVKLAPLNGEIQVHQWVQRFNPEMHIPEEATACHHITDADVADQPKFIDKALQIARALYNKDLCGYNLRRLDLPILDEELRRCGYALDLTGVRVIDCYGIFSKKEPRSLADAVRKYCNHEHADAHGALPDALATAEVLRGQLAMYQDLADLDLDALAKYSKNDDKEFIDICGKLYRDKDGFARWNFGKNKDKRIADDMGFADWVLKKDFPGSTKDAIREELRRLAENGY